MIMGHKIIGLTGGIGAGKSVVARVLRLKGFKVYDCDLRASILMQKSEKIVSALTGRFGKECYQSEGTLNRRYLSARIFAEEEERLWVNTLVHTAVRDDLLLWAEEKNISFVESAILHSSGLDMICKEIWVVDAPEELRFRRAMERGGIDAEDLRRRMRIQEGELDGLPAEKVRRIDNSGRVSLLMAIDALLKEIRTKIY